MATKEDVVSLGQYLLSNVTFVPLDGLTAGLIAAHCFNWLVEHANESRLEEKLRANSQLSESDLELLLRARKQSRQHIHDWRMALVPSNPDFFPSWADREFSGLKWCSECGALSQYDRTLIPTKKEEGPE